LIAKAHKTIELTANTCHGDVINFDLRNELVIKASLGPRARDGICSGCQSFALPKTHYLLISLKNILISLARRSERRGEKVFASSTKRLERAGRKSFLEKKILQQLIEFQLVDESRVSFGAKGEEKGQTCGKIFNEFPLIERAR
jgi:hypothetical protein